MRGSGWRSLLVVCLGLVGACDVPQEVTDQITCQDLCRCLGGLPAQQQQCETTCISRLAPVPAACTTCVEDNLGACSAMLTACPQLCEPPATPLEGEPR